MKPLIGINCDIKEGSPFLNPEYSEAVKKAGGEPRILDPRKTDDIEGLLKGLDGLLLSGGRDIWPYHYTDKPHPKTNPVSKERDIFDFRLAQQALEMDKPILGICLGAQLINVVLGGSLIQDIPSQRPPNVPHNSKTDHKIRVEQGTHLYEFLKAEALMVNSSHHQAIDRLGEGLKVSATAEDGIVEAVEGTRHPLVMGVQWHPERMLEDSTQRRLFTAFLEEVKGHAPKRA